MIRVRIPTDFSTVSRPKQLRDGRYAESSPLCRLYDAPVAGLSSAASGTEKGGKTGKHGSVPSVCEPAAGVRLGDV